MIVGNCEERLKLDSRGRYQERGSQRELEQAVRFLLRFQVGTRNGGCDGAKVWPLDRFKTTTDRHNRSRLLRGPASRRTRNSRRTSLELCLSRFSKSVTR